jgi:single-stranded DNA-binding protein
MPVIDWRRVTTWVGLAEVVNAYMATGKRVQVIGRLEYQSWTDKASGEQPSRAVVVASQMLRFAATLLRRRPCGGMALDDEPRQRGWGAQVIDDLARPALGLPRPAGPLAVQPDGYERLRGGMTRCAMGASTACTSYLV